VVCGSCSPERKPPAIGTLAANPESHLRPMLRFVSHTPKPSALNAALLQGLIFKSVTFMVVSASCWCAQYHRQWYLCQHRQR